MNKYAKAARRVVSSAVRRRSPQTIVLLYHRVAEAGSDPQLLSVSPAHFEQHLDAITSRFRAVASEDLDRSDRPRRSVLVTFDDGYADNYLNARPILHKFDVPATIFVATGNVGSKKEYWWDELERLLLTSTNLPSVLRLRTLEYEREIGSAQENGSWDVLSDRPPTPRQRAYLELHDRLKRSGAADRTRTLNELRAATGVGQEGRPTHRAMTAEEIREMAEGGLIEIGAHTVSHSRLSELDEAAQQQEIVESKRFLEDLLDRCVDSFSYPFGGHNDYDETSQRVVREAGFARAFANAPGLVGRSTPFYEIPRMLVRDWDGDAFAKRLDAWLSR